MATINLNVSPYFDDYSDAKDYLQVLFRPGFAVQARELTQLQTIFRHQLSRFGNHFFKDGSAITEGNIHLNTQVFTMNLLSVEGDVDFPISGAEAGSTEGNIGDFSELIISNSDQSVKARVIKTPTGIDTTAKSGRIYLSYLTKEKFSATDVGYVYARSSDNEGVTQTYVNVFGGVNEATLAVVEEGVYYLDGFFTRVAAQNVVVSNTTNKPTASIGFSLNSKAITSNDDASLFDNARGSTNEGAPGANRLQNSISVVVKSAVDQGADPTFYKQLDVLNGVIQGITNTNPDASTPNPQYAVLGEVLAQRTKEESGSYVIEPFVPKIINRIEDSEYFAVSLSKGKAYVNGYRVETLDDTQVLVDRNLNEEKLFNYSWPIDGVPYVETNANVSSSQNYGTLPGFGDSDSVSVGSFAGRVCLKDSEGFTIGYARPYAYQKTSTNKGRLFIHDVKMFSYVVMNDSETTYTQHNGQEIRTNTGTAIVNDLSGAYVDSTSTEGFGDSDWVSKISTDTNGAIPNYYGPEGVNDSEAAETNYNRGFLVTNLSGTLRSGQNLETDFGNLDGKTIRRVVTFPFKNVREIRGNIKSGVSNPEFRVKVGSDDSDTTLKNTNSSLITFSTANVKSMRSGIEALDNDFNMLYRSPPTITSTSGGLTVTPSTTDTQFNGSGSEFFNGSFKKARVDDAVEITKNKKFAFLKIRNAAKSSRTSTVNTSWSATDRLINLFYSDIYEVYGIAKGQKSNSFDATNPATEPNAGFTRLSISVDDGAVIKQGSVIIGKESGTRAIVALQNSTAIEETLLSNTTGYHITRAATGSATKIDVIFQTGVAFIANEELKIVPESGTFSSKATFTGIDSTRLAGQDITQNYLFDNGQRKNAYQVGSIIRKDGVAAPNEGDIVVFFSYYDTDPTESFFYNADSYSGDDFFRSDPRYFEGPQDIKNFDRADGLNLRNAVDFRLRQKLSIGASTAQNPLAFCHRNYEDTGSVIIPDSRFTSDTIFYKPQNSSIILTQDGDFKLVEGEASFDPQFPIENPDAMKVADLDVPSVVRYPEKEVAITSNVTRRYTMEDIARLDERITNVEETVSLNLLETQALLENTDDRLKLGFVVDDFSSQQGIADISNPNFRAQIETQDQTLHPASVDDTFELRVNTTSNIDPYYLDQGPGYVMKSYTQERMLQQEFASSTVRVNPYATWVYSGSVECIPPQDFWRDSSSRVVSGYAIDRTEFGGGISSVNQKTFNNIKAVTRDIPGSEFSTTKTRVTGVKKTTRTREVSSAERKRLKAQGVTQTSQGLRLKTTTTTTTSKKTTKNFIKQERETTQATQFREREVRELDDAFIRSRQIILRSEGMRPGVVLKVLFDGQDVTRFCQQIDFDVDVANSPNPSFGSLGSVVTDPRGRLQIRFTIPANTFKTGTKRIVIVDADGSNTTQAIGSFTSRGFYAVGDLVKIRTTSPLNNRLVSTDTQTVTSTKKTRQLYDPVAQAFTLPLDAGADPNNFDPNADVPRDSGSFITSVDTFFGFVDDRPLMNTATLQIRNMINGYPGPEVLGEGKINLTKATNQNLNEPIKATNFRLDAPCYLNANTEYAIVILSPSDLTTVWTAAQGEIDITTGGKIDKQPNVGGYYGSFFKSQNNSTWTADQNRDLTFRVYRAKFDSADGEIKLRDTQNFMIQPIGQAASGLVFQTFENSNYIKVYHPNHGMYGPDDTHNVRIFGAEHNFVKAADDSEISLRSLKTLNGIPVSRINNIDFINNMIDDSDGNTHSVKFATQDSYFIKIEMDSDAQTTAMKKGVTSGFGGGLNVLATSNLQYDLISSNLIPTIFDGTTLSQKFIVKNGHVVNLNVNNSIVGYNTTNIHQRPFGSRSAEFDVPVDEMIRLGYPQIILGQLNKTGTNDFESIIKLSSDNEYLSPVFRLDAALNMFTIRNVGGTTITDSDIDTNLTTTSVMASSNDTVNRQLASYHAGIQSSLEVANYQTKEVDLELPATQIRVFFEADMEPDTEILVKYKARKAGDDTPIEELKWQTFPRNQIVNETNFAAFASDEDFREYTLLQNVGFEFDTFKVALEMKSGNEALVQRVKNLRVLCTI